jgi:hypothetical protein
MARKDTVRARRPPGPASWTRQLAPQLEEAHGVTGARPGRHPDFWAVTLGQLLATWVAHDLSHLGRVVRVMARQYAEAVGAWRQYLRILAR